jgi:hypothetical protein
VNDGDAQDGPSELPGQLRLAPEWQPPVLSTAVPHPHRVYDYLVGGKENYQVDRDAAAELLAQVPDLGLTVSAMESFIARSITRLATEGISQFLQVSNAVITPYNNGKAVSHAVARGACPSARYVYIAEDPVTIASIRAGLSEQDTADVAAVKADFRDPGDYLEHPAVLEKLDLSKPVGILLFCMFDFMADQDQAARALNMLYQWAPAGSRIALFQMLDWGIEDWTVFSPSILASIMEAQMTLRTPQQVGLLLAPYVGRFDPPGLVPAPQWYPDGSGPEPELGDRSALLAAVMTKP